MFHLNNFLLNSFFKVLRLFRIRNTVCAEHRNNCDVEESLFDGQGGFHYRN